jgi:hypothetical protein
MSPTSTAVPRRLRESEEMMKAEYIEDNNALREEIARAHAVLDKAGIPEPGLRFSERIKILVARERRLRKALEDAVILLEFQAARALEQKYHPTTPHRYAALLRGFASEDRFALRVATDAKFASRAALAPEEEEQR